MISKDLTQMVNFTTQITNCESQSPAPLYSVISPNPSICSTVPVLLFGNSDHVVDSVFSFHFL